MRGLKFATCVITKVFGASVRNLEAAAIRLQRKAVNASILDGKGTLWLDVLALRAFMALESNKNLLIGDFEPWK